MGLEIMIWAIVLGLGLLAYFASFYFRTPHLFVLGCALLIGSGALLWGFDGLILSQQVSSVSEAGVISYTPVVVTMENVGLAMTALFLIASGILSALVIDFGGSSVSKKNVYHY